MAVKTFTTGEVLTAADTNTYLANSGLVFVKQVTIGSAVSSVEVTSAFSSAHDVYRIVMANGTASASYPNLQFQFSGISSGSYYGGYVGTTYNTNAVVGLGVNGATSWTYTGIHASGNQMDITVFNANKAQRKYVQTGFSFTGVGNYGHFSGECTGATAETAFKIIPSSGTLTGGIITVYGYRLG